jgi:hypothetical protein
MEHFEITEEFKKKLFEILDERYEKKMTAGDKLVKSFIIPLQEPKIEVSSNDEMNEEKNEFTKCSRKIKKEGGDSDYYASKKKYKFSKL